MKNFVKKPPFIIFFAVFTVVLSVSCTRSAPEIKYGFLQLVLYQDKDGPQESYSFFILPEDEDGIDNLDELYLYHDREQLRWNIKSDEWQRYTHDGKEWIGTRSFTVREGELPKGLFRAVLINKGGESVERSFTYDGGVRYPFPEIDITDGVYNVNSQWPVNRLVCYDNAGNYLSTVNLPSKTGQVSDLKVQSNARTAALWAEDEVNFCSAFTNVVSLH
jgi:hypothetical protein